MSEDNTGNSSGSWPVLLLVRRCAPVRPSVRTGHAPRTKSRRLDRTQESLSETGRDLYDQGRDLYGKGRKIADEAASLFDKGRKLVEGEESA